MAQAFGDGSTKGKEIREAIHGKVYEMLYELTTWQRRILIFLAIVGTLCILYVLAVIFL